MSDGERDPYIVFGRPHFGPEELEEVMDSLRSGWVGTGPKVAAFEETSARYAAAEHAVAVNSCTAALHLSMLAREEDVSGLAWHLDHLLSHPDEWGARARIGRRHVQEQHDAATLVNRLEGLYDDARRIISGGTAS